MVIGARHASSGCIARHVPGSAVVLGARRISLAPAGISAGAGRVARWRRRDRRRGDWRRRPRQPRADETGAGQADRADAVAVVVEVAGEGLGRGGRRRVARTKRTRPSARPTPSSSVATPSLKPAGAMARGMAPKTSIGGIGTCDDSRHAGQPAQVLGDHPHGGGVEAIALAERVGQLVVRGRALAPHDLGPHDRAVAGVDLAEDVVDGGPRLVQDGGHLGGVEVMTAVEVEHVADLLAEQVGGLPQEGGDGRIGAQRAGVGAPGQAILGVETHGQAHVDPAAVGGGHLLAGGPQDEDAEGIGGGLLGQAPVHGGERLGLELDGVDGGEALAGDAVVDGIGPSIEQESEGRGVSLAGQGDERVVSVPTLRRCQGNPPPRCTRPAGGAVVLVPDRHVPSVGREGPVFRRVLHVINGIAAVDSIAR